MAEPVETSYLYILAGDDWPVRSSWPLSTSVPVTRGDVFELYLRSDVADHKLEVEVVRVRHCQTAGSRTTIDSGSFLECRVTQHTADPIGTLGILSEQSREYFLPRPPRRRRPRLRIVPS